MCTWGKHSDTRIDGKVTIGRENDTLVKNIIIGDNVMLYSRVAVMGGVTIENNSAIAYGSIVTKNCKENIIYAGIPAKKIGERI